jgi:hypothetical protein
MIEVQQLSLESATQTVRAFLLHNLHDLLSMLLALMGQARRKVIMGGLGLRAAGAVDRFFTGKEE